MFAVILSLMLCLSAIPVYAEETTIYDGGNADIPVEYTAESHYSVTIPEVINLNNSSFSMTFYADITDSEVINVSIGDSNIHLSNASGDTTTGYLTRIDGSHIDGYQPIIQYRKGDNSNQSFDYIFSAADARAGKWTGSLTFYFDLTGQE